MNNPCILPDGSTEWSCLNALNDSYVGRFVENTSIEWVVGMILIVGLCIFASVYLSFMLYRFVYGVKK